MEETAHAFLDARHAQDPLVELGAGSGLYLGCYPAVCSRRALAERGVTHVLNAAAGACRSPFAAELRYLDLALDDTPQARIAAHFDAAADFISDALAGGGRVAVHCQAGVSRSVTLCVAYLCARERLSLFDALDRVRRARHIAQPNSGFMRQLRHAYGRKHDNDSNDDSIDDDAIQY